ncbi:Trp operon leader peptide [Vibrio atypicus]|nr:Trp operon leader peptide [Vibrio atypicus]
MLQEISNNQKVKVETPMPRSSSADLACNLEWWRTWTSSWWASVYF